MADISITTYQNKVYKQGASTSSPGFVVGDSGDPINPTGTIPLYKTLGDTLDSSFIGKDGFVPVVVNESQLQLIPMPQVEQNGLISGGIVQWTGSGYNFNVSGATYRIAGTLYTSDPDLVTLGTPDPTNDRIDVFAVDVNGAVVVIAGTPAASPVKPQVDPSTQLELTSVIVTAASTQPTLTEEIIYDQNTEWTGTSSGTGTANFASTNNPFQGSVSVETTNIQNGFYIQFNNGSTIDISAYQTLGFQLRLKASMPSGQNLFITFLDGSGVACSNTVLLNFDKTNASAYQFVGVVLSSIFFTSNNVQYVRISFVRTSGSTTYSGYFLDILKIEGGINPPSTINTFTGLQDTPNSYSGQAGKVVAVKTDESGLEFITAGGGGITGSGTTNEIAYFTGSTAIGSLSTATYPSLTELSYVKGVTSSIQTQLNSKPTTFLGLTDTPSAYTSQANKWVRVNGIPNALIFDTVSPYDLDQEGATDGQVLAWSAANSRYQPLTISSGGSKWTDVGVGNIYRNSRISVNHTADPTEAIDLGLTSGWVKTAPGASNAGGILLPYTTANANSRGWTIRNDAAAFGELGFTVSNTAAGDPKLGTIKFRITPFSNIGVNGAPDAFGNYAYFSLYGLSTTQGGVFIAKTSNNSHTFQLRVDSTANHLQAINNPMIFYCGTSGLERMRITNGGNLLIGTTTDLSSRLYVAGESRFQGNLVFMENVTTDMIFGTTTGSKIAQATNQKFAFWGKTPIVQPTNAIAGAARVAGGGTTITDTDTFGGYTIAQLAAIIINTGLGA
jgi:hypothetical protein